MKYRTLFIAMILPAIFALAVPFASAEEPTVCGTLNTFSRKTVDAVSERADALEHNRTARLDQLAAQWADQDSQKVLGRRQAEEIKSADFSSLEKALANAPESQKKALVIFEASLNSAAAARQTAIDDATKTFRTGVQAALRDRSKELRSATDDFTRSIQTSLGDALATCVGGSALVKTNDDIKNKLESARQKFQKDPRLNAAKPVDLSQLTAQYQAAIQAATKAFKSQVLSAQSEFKASLH